MDIKICFWDIETLFEMSIFGFKYEGVWYAFEISKRRNDTYKIARFVEKMRDEGVYLVGYNTLSFDSQVLEYLYRRHETWEHLSCQEITARIWRYAQDTIDNSRHGLLPAYPEDRLLNKHIDLFKIHHFDNEHKMTSLKWLEYMMNLENIEEMPIHHALIEDINGYKKPVYRDFTDEELEMTLYYWRNDIHATEAWWRYTIGEVEHEEYRGKNKIFDRLALIEEFNLPNTFLNYADVKIGDELNKLGYCSLTNIAPKELYDLKKRRRPTGRITFGDCLPDYISFKTPELQDFLERMKSTRVSFNDSKQEYPVYFKGTKFNIARGGIHTNEKHRIIIPGSHQILRDADVASQYPNAIVKRRLFPSHLGAPWLVRYDNTIHMRIEYKDKSHEDTPDGRKAKSIQETLKLALNGGGFGKTNEATNWQYDPIVTFACTIGNQFEILMLIEEMEMNHIRVVSANTDGILCLFDKNQEETYFRICKEWEEKVGNVKMGKLEFQDFKALYQENVNCYIAVKVDGKAKVKGRLAKDGPLNKNNSKDIGRIERDAIVNYFHKNIPVEDTIKNSKNIYDFCIGMKATRNYRYEAVDTVTGHKLAYNRVIRYFYSTQGRRLLKVKNEWCETKGAAVTRIGGENLITMFNQAYHVPMEEYNIDYDFYIENAKRIITQIETGSKIITFKDPNQLGLDF